MVCDDIRIIEFRLLNAPSTVKHLINHVLKPFSCKFVVVYFNDILVYFINVVTHLEYLYMVIEVLWRNKLSINLKKCSFLQSNVNFLGFIISVNEIRAIELNIQDIKGWLIPKAVVKLGVFMGWLCFIRDSIVVLAL